MRQSLQAALVMAVLVLAPLAAAQAPDPHKHPAPANAPNPDAGTQQELQELREQIRQLQRQVGPATKRPASTGMQMGQRAMPGAKAGAPMAPSPMGGMGMMQMMDGGMMGMMGMMGMGSMGSSGTGSMAVPSALPGFPGQSHLYHIGATGFFLDHPEHIALTMAQEQDLARRKQQSLMQQEEFDRQIERAEQELWQLTGADQPQAGAIEKKIREIEKLRSDQRLAFIRSVGDATNVLGATQRQQLVGALPPATQPSAMPGMNEPATPQGSMAPMPDM